MTKEVAASSHCNEEDNPASASEYEVLVKTRKQENKNVTGKYITRSSSPKKKTRSQLKKQNFDDYDDDEPLEKCIDAVANNKNREKEKMKKPVLISKKEVTNIKEMSCVSVSSSSSDDDKNDDDYSPCKNTTSKSITRNSSSKKKGALKKNSSKLKKKINKEVGKLNFNEKYISKTKRNRNSISSSSNNSEDAEFEKTLDDVVNKKNEGKEKMKKPISTSNKEVTNSKETMSCVIVSSSSSDDEKNDTDYLPCKNTTSKSKTRNSSSKLRKKINIKLSYNEKDISNNNLKEERRKNQNSISTSSDDSEDDELFKIGLDVVVNKKNGGEEKTKKSVLTPNKRVTKYKYKETMSDVSACSSSSDGDKEDTDYTPQKVRNSASKKKRVLKQHSKSPKNGNIKKKRAKVQIKSCSNDDSSDENEPLVKIQIKSENEGAKRKIADVSSDGSSDIENKKPLKKRKRTSFSKSKNREIGRDNEKSNSSNNDNDNNGDTNIVKKNPSMLRNETVLLTKINSSSKIDASDDDQENNDKKSTKDSSSSSEDSDVGDKINSEPVDNENEKPLKNNKPKKKRTVLTSKKGEQDSTKLTNLKRYHKLANGKTVRNYAIIFKDCISMTSKERKLKSLLKDMGIKGKPTMAKCKRAFEKKERMEDATELDATNIITTSGRRTRATSRNQNNTSTKKYSFGDLTDCLESQSDEDGLDSLSEETIVKENNRKTELKGTRNRTTTKKILSSDESDNEEGLNDDNSNNSDCKINATVTLDVEVRVTKLDLDNVNVNL